MNSLFLIGNLTKDPEIGKTPEGDARCAFSIAVRRWDANKGTDFFRILTYGRMAENCAEYLSKGARVAVSGRVRMTVFMRRDGEPGGCMDVLAGAVEFLTPKEKAEIRSKMPEGAEGRDEKPEGTEGRGVIPEEADGAAGGAGEEPLPF